jgi:hypothetical protein
VQQHAFDNPEPADHDTAELMGFYRDEVLRRAA